MTTREYKKSGYKNDYWPLYYTPRDLAEIDSSTNPLVVLLRNTIPDEKKPVVIITFTERKREENCYVTISLDPPYAAKKTKEQLKEWRAMIHKIIAELTGATWFSERGQVGFFPGKCKKCENRMEWSDFQEYSCMCCCEDSCGCPHGVGSQRGWPKCSVNDMCEPTNRKCVFNGIHAYPYASTSPPKASIKLRKSNNQKKLFSLMKPLMLANKFCGPEKHVEKGCFFEYQKLPWELLYLIMKNLLTQDKTKRGDFEIIRKIPKRKRISK